MKPTHLDPDKTLGDPYDPEYMPLPTASGLRALGIFPTKTGSIKVDDDKSVQVGARIPPAILYAIDRILERKIFKVANRAEFIRTAIINRVFELSEEIQEGRIKLTIKRLEMMRRASAEAQQLGDINEMAVLTRKNADLYVASDSNYLAVRALRDAKRYMEDIPSEGLQQQFANKSFGAKDGKGRPDGWQEDETAVLWDKVLNGELDFDQDEQERQKARLA